MGVRAVDGFQMNPCLGIAFGGRGGTLPKISPFPGSSLPPMTGQLVGGVQRPGPLAATWDISEGPSQPLMSVSGWL